MKNLRILTASILLVGSTQILSKTNGDYYRDGVAHARGIVDTTSASYAQGLLNGFIQIAGSIAQVPVASLTPQIFPLLTVTQIQALSTAQIQALSTAQIQALTAGQMPSLAVTSLSKAQVQVLSTAQLKALTASQLASVRSNLTAAQASSLPQFIGIGLPHV